MIDVPIHDIQVVHESLMTDAEKKHVANAVCYQMSEVDLSFIDVLGATCSGSGSSSPQPTPGA